MSWGPCLRSGYCARGERYAAEDVRFAGPGPAPRPPPRSRVSLPAMASSLFRWICRLLRWEPGRSGLHLLAEHGDLMQSGGHFQEVVIHGFGDGRTAPADRKRGLDAGSMTTLNWRGLGVAVGGDANGVCAGHDPGRGGDGGSVVRNGHVGVGAGATCRELARIACPRGSDDGRESRLECAARAPRGLGLGSGGRAEAPGRYC